MDLTHAGDAQQETAAAKMAAAAKKGTQSTAPWVVTGAVADEQYQAARRDARDHMRMRNICFQQACRPTNPEPACRASLSCTTGLPACGPCGIIWSHTVTAAELLCSPERQEGQRWRGVHLVISTG